MTQKKLLLLGGLRYLIPVIKAAKEQGYYVITCDYIPDNIAHKHSDEYHNISILDKEAILALAQDLKIDGILSFAVDPGVATASYVAEKMGLPGLPYNSVKILQDKALFREFLEKNNFNVPMARGYSNYQDAIADISLYKWPVIVKPVDSAGSKGVTKVNKQEDLCKSVEIALAASISKNFIIEEFIEQKGFSSDSDSFSVDGEFKVLTFTDQRFDQNADNPFTPSAYSWPSTISDNHQKELQSELQRLITLLGLGTSIYNIETRVGMDNKPYIMEVSPRGGGNRLSEMVRYASSVDMITSCVRAAVGDPLSELEMPKYKGNWAIIILHSDSEGSFVKLEINPTFAENHIKEIDLWVNPGDCVSGFRGANDTIGTLVLNFNSQHELTEALAQQSKWLQVIVE